MPKFSPLDLYVSPAGRDGWSGRLPEPNADETDGPLATIGKARDLVRSQRRRAVHREPVTVWLRGGRYATPQPIRFGPEDSGPTTYAAYPGETPVLDGGMAVSQWEETTVHGQRAWVADVSELLKTRGIFRSLFVNGQRRHRPRLPKQGFFWMTEAPHVPGGGLFDGANRFRVDPADWQPDENLRDTEIVAMHFWVEERMPLASYDTETGWCESSRHSIFVLKDDVHSRAAKYYVENLFAALTEPGEWFLDRQAGKLYYLPLPDETPGNSTVIVPQTLQLLRVFGAPDGSASVTGLCFRGLTFEHTDWQQACGYGKWYDPYTPPAEWRTRDSYRHFTLNNGADPFREYAAMPQAAFHVPAALQFEFAEECSVEDCRIAHIGWYGVELGEGCRGCRLVGNEITDLGAGGIKLDGADDLGDVYRRTGCNRLTDNHIHDGGHIFLSACGVAMIHSFGNEVSHNHIHDFYYSGISCGWVWGYADNVSKENRIEKNHIHDLGKGVLSDMGGIYTLGVQPGTQIRGNLIHDIEKSNYGGWAIYSDEGSAHLIIENNVSYNTSSQPYHMHYGREITIRNNIWAFGREGQIACSRGPAAETNYPWCGKNQHCALTFEHNIVITDGQPCFVTGYGNDADPALRPYKSDLNVFWDVNGGPIISGRPKGMGTGVEDMISRLDWEAWQALGYDRHSLVADPKCADPRNGDFTLAEDSPALELGFEPIDLSDVGPREPGKRSWH